MSDNELPRVTIVQEQPYVLFGRLLLCGYDSASVAYLPFYELCQEFGLNGVAQRALVHQHHILQDSICLGQIDGTDVTLLRLDAVALWLSMLPEQAIAQTPIIAELIALQVTAAFVLHEALAAGYLTDLPLAGGLLNEGDPALLVYRQAIHLLHLARENLHLDDER